MQKFLLVVILLSLLLGCGTEALQKDDQNEYKFADPLCRVQLEQTSFNTWKNDGDSCAEFLSENSGWFQVRVDVSGPKSKYLAKEVVVGKESVDINAPFSPLLFVSRIAQSNNQLPWLPEDDHSISVIFDFEESASENFHPWQLGVELKSRSTP